MVKIKSKWDKLDDNAKKWASRLTAVATIIGVLTAGGGWIINQLDNAVASRLEAQTASLQKEVEVLSKDREEADKQTSLQLMRLELMTLMEVDPSNVVEIEKVARQYFQSGGNSYMTSMYTKYCKNYGADCEVMFR